MGYIINYISLLHSKNWNFRRHSVKVFLCRTSWMDFLLSLKVVYLPLLHWCVYTPKQENNWKIFILGLINFLNIMFYCSELFFQECFFQLLTALLCLKMHINWKIIQLIRNCSSLNCLFWEVCRITTAAVTRGKE